MTFNLYGLVLGLAILAAFEASLWLAKERKIDSKIVEGLFWWAVGGGVIGARIYHVLDKWGEIYSLNPIAVFYIWRGGLGIWGAVIGGVLGLVLVVKVHRIKVPFWGLLDSAFFGLPLGQAIGRWGNFFNGEISGKNGEPLFLYESVLNLVLFGILVRLAKSDKFKKRPGAIVGAYLAGYGLVRLFLEGFRQSGDQWLIGGLPMAIIFSAIAVITGGLILRKTLSSRGT